jgi:hypothetical protein
MLVRPDLSPGRRSADPQTDGTGVVAAVLPGEIGGRNRLVWVSEQ